MPHFWWFATRASHSILRCVLKGPPSNVKKSLCSKAAESHCRPLSRQVLLILATECYWQVGNALGCESMQCIYFTKQTHNRISPSYSPSHVQCKEVSKSCHFLLPVSTAQLYSKLWFFLLLLSSYTGRAATKHKSFFFSCNSLYKTLIYLIASEKSLAKVRFVNC